MTHSSATHLAENDPSAATQLRSNTERLLFLLHRGGAYAHLWTDAGNRSHWFATKPSSMPETVSETGPETVDVSGQRSASIDDDQPISVATDTRKGKPRKRKQLLQRVRRVPKPWLRHNIYFSVHPLSQIPPHNTTGKRDRRFISSQTAYICAVNALFAEFDGKEYVYTIECRDELPAGLRTMNAIERQQTVKAAKERLFYRDPARFKKRVLHHLFALHMPPSVIIDSGGGYHCYWLLRQTVPIDEANRDDVEVIQHGWVQMVNGDSGAADLRRVLRLPGSYNHKPGFADRPPRVDFVKAEFGLLYDYAQLEEAVTDWLYERSKRRATHRQHKPRQGDRAPLTAAQEAARAVEATLRQRFNQQQGIEALLLRHGYRLCAAARGQSRLARPGRDRLHASVTIFPAQREGATERSVHFSTNDPLYSREYIDEQSGKVRRQSHDAFYLYGMLEHEGNWTAAYAALATQERVHAA